MKRSIMKILPKRILQIEITFSGNNRHIFKNHCFQIDLEEINVSTKIPSQSLQPISTKILNEFDFLFQAKSFWI